MHTKTSILFLLVILFFLGACSWLSPAREEAADNSIGPSGPNTAVEVPIKMLEQNKANNVELIWQASDEAVDAFIIHYGVSPSDLNQQTRVDARAVERFADSQYGMVYRFVLRDIPPGQSVFVAISSVHGSAISEPSPVFEVKADDNTLLPK